MTILAMIAGYLALSLALTVLFCFAVAPVPPRLEDDQHTPEAPHLPPQVIKAMSANERIQQREQTAYERAHNLQMWELFCAREDAKRRAT